MKIKKIILNIAIVFIVVFVLDFAIGSTLRNFFFKESSGLHYRTTYAMETTKAEILVFGSSRANHHYVPEIFEDSLKMSFYNTGRDGNGVFFQTALLKSILKRYTPKIIILDYAGGFGKEANDYDRISSLLPYYKKHEEIRNIIELKSPFERMKLLSKIYPFNSEILTIAIGNLDINKKMNSDNKGYVALYKEWQSNIDSIDPVSDYEVDSNKLDAFRVFINTAKKSGAKVYVIFSPIFLKYNRSQDIEICNEICSAENVCFWDYSKDKLFLNNNGFFQDVQHLNHNGALIFSKLICNSIQHDIN
jgi:hypothetical protein